MRSIDLELLFGLRPRKTGPVAVPPAVRTAPVRRASGGATLLAPTAPGVPPEWATATAPVEPRSPEPAATALPARLRRVRVSSRAPRRSGPAGIGDLGRIIPEGDGKFVQGVRLASLAPEEKAEDAAFVSRRTPGALR